MVGGQGRICDDPLQFYTYVAAFPGWVFSVSGFGTSKTGLLKEIYLLRSTCVVVSFEGLGVTVP